MTGQLSCLEHDMGSSLGSSPHSRGEALKVGEGIQTNTGTLFHWSVIVILTSGKCKITELNIKT